MECGRTFMATVSLPLRTGSPYLSVLSHCLRCSRSGWLQILRRMSIPASAFFRSCTGRGQVRFTHDGASQLSLEPFSFIRSFQAGWIRDFV